MDKIRIKGGRPVIGQIEIAGAKNAVLPIMAACLLTDETIELTNIPQLMDVITMCHLLDNFGVEIEKDDVNNSHTMTAKNIKTFVAPYEIVRKMRASILVLGPILSRFGQASVSIPGGCAIGTRPIDLHIEALKAMGAEIEIQDGYVNASVNGKLKGARIKFKQISVGATENILMAATLAEGTTYLENAASEPEIVDLGNCLIAMGAQISGLGTREITIHGVDRLHGCKHAIIPDRIEAGTFLIAAAITGGLVELVGVVPGHLTAVIKKLRETGVNITVTDNTITLDARGIKIRPVDIETEEYPGIPTDMQAQFMTLMTVADGNSIIRENIFENRFMHVAELLRMGANITNDTQTAQICGVERLKSAPVMATDLRASVSLVLAALVADGETVIHRVYHLDRGYEHLEKKLSACGISIAREKARVLV